MMFTYCIFPVEWEAKFTVVRRPSHSGLVPSSRALSSVQLVHGTARLNEARLCFLSRARYEISDLIQSFAAARLLCPIHTALQTRQNSPACVVSGVAV